MARELLLNVPTHPKTPYEWEQVRYLNLQMQYLPEIAHMHKMADEAREQASKPITIFEAKDHKSQRAYFHEALLGRQRGRRRP